MDPSHTVTPSAAVCDKQSSTGTLPSCKEVFETLLHIRLNPLHFQKSQFHFSFQPICSHGNTTLCRLGDTSYPGTYKCSTKLAAVRGKRRTWHVSQSDTHATSLLIRNDHIQLSLTVMCQNMHAHMLISKLTYTVTRYECGCTRVHISAHACSQPPIPRYHEASTRQLCSILAAVTSSGLFPLNTQGAT